MSFNLKKEDTAKPGCSCDFFFKGAYANVALVLSKGKPTSKKVGNLCSGDKMHHHGQR